MINLNEINIGRAELRILGDLTDRNEHSEAAARLAAWTYLKVEKPGDVIAAAWLMNELRLFWHAHEERGCITIEDSKLRGKLMDELLDLIGRALGINTREAIASVL